MIKVLEDTEQLAALNLTYFEELTENLPSISEMLSRYQPVKK